MEEHQVKDYEELSLEDYQDAVSRAWPKLTARDRVFLLLMVEGQVNGRRQAVALERVAKALEELFHRLSLGGKL